MGAWNFSYDAVDRLASATAGAGAPLGLQGQTGSWSYDASGNTLNDGSNQYWYDAEGQLCAVKNLMFGTMTGYIYGADGTRVSTGTIGTWGSCDPTANGYQATKDSILGPSGGQLTETGVDANGNVAWAHTNVWANGELIATYDPNGLHFYLNDWLGSRRVQTDYEGVVEQTCANLPYGDGKTCGPSPTEDLFAGLEYDSESGLDHALYRQYASAMGRWTTPDPYAGSYNLADPQSLNRYAYVNGRPMAAIDPSGQDAAGIGCGAALAQGGADAGNDALCIFLLVGGPWVDDHLLGWLFRPQFHGSLKPRPTTPGSWDSTFGGTTTLGSPLGAAGSVGQASGLPTMGAGCEFGACGAGPMGFDPNQIEDHHIFAQEFWEWFEAQGLGDLKNLTIPLTALAHRMTAGRGLHTKVGGNWNKVWQQWIEEHPNATPQAIIDQAKRMAAVFGISVGDTLSDFIITVNPCLYDKTLQQTLPSCGGGALD